MINKYIVLSSKNLIIVCIFFALSNICLADSFGSDAGINFTWSWIDTVAWVVPYPNPLSTGQIGILDSARVSGHDNWDDGDLLFGIVYDNRNDSPGIHIATTIEYATLTAASCTQSFLKFNAESFIGDDDSLWIGFWGKPDAGNDMGACYHDSGEACTHDRCFYILGTGDAVPGDETVWIVDNNCNGGPHITVYYHQSAGTAPNRRRRVILGMLGRGKDMKYWSDGDIDLNGVRIWRVWRVPTL